MAHELKKEWTTEAGLKAYVLYVNNSHHCGYVQAPTIYENIDYDDMYSEVDINVHGGLTFAGTISDINKTWLFGFDAAHLGDATMLINSPGDTFKDVDYMAKECELLAKQLMENLDD